MSKRRKNSLFLFLTSLFIPAGTLHDNVILTSMQRNDVAYTSVRRHFDVVCPLGFKTASLLPNDIIAGYTPSHNLPRLVWVNNVSTIVANSFRNSLLSLLDDISLPHWDVLLKKESYTEGIKLPPLNTILIERELTPKMTQLRPLN